MAQASSEKDLLPLEELVQRHSWQNTMCANIPAKKAFCLAVALNRAAPQWATSANGRLVGNVPSVIDPTTCRHPTSEGVLTSLIHCGDIYRMRTICKSLCEVFPDNIDEFHVHPSLARLIVATEIGVHTMLW